MINNVDINSFSARDMRGVDRWESRDESTIAFATQFPVITLVGTGTYDLRWRIVGRKLEGQITFSGSTSIASTAGTSYFILPVAATGICGRANFSNLTTNLGAAQGVIDITNDRCYLPTIAATPDLIGGTFEYEVA